MLLCMSARTTIRLDEDLLKEAKRVAIDSGKTLNEVIEDSVREAMLRRRAGTKRKKIDLPTFDGNGVLPGVDLYDSGSLWELMDETDADPGR
jgi:hypothetical protein